MKRISIDIETRSAADIGKTGHYKYAQDGDFAVLLIAYKVDDDPVRIVDLTKGERLPAEVLAALMDNSVHKYAYNAAFEWWCLNAAGIPTDLDGWRCTMVAAMYAGFPSGLAMTGRAVGLPQDKQKQAVGTRLIKKFCKPPYAAPEGDDWELFKGYCMQDVVAESAIADVLAYWPMPESEWELWRMDVRMNALGVRIDEGLVRGALAVDAEDRRQLKAEALAVTHLANPDSPAQLKNWLAGYGIEADSINKETVTQLLARDDLPAEVRRMCELRRQLGRTSVKKYQAMQTAVCPDGRVRGLMQFYGASRTGRWAGRLVQVQNLRRNAIGTLDEARHIVRGGEQSEVKAFFGDVQDTLSQLIRTAFVPEVGKRFIVSDFSAIEARVIAWLAGEEWVNEVFATHGKIYEATASQMFGVPVEKIKKGNPEYSLRQKGKVATLALGYQGGTGSLEAMGALAMGLSPEELPDIVQRWRAANPAIVALWYETDRKVKQVIQTGMPQYVRGLPVAMEYGALTIGLPSGRKLHYQRAHIGEGGKFGGECIKYFDAEGVNWSAKDTYGGRLTENTVQAVARDCLAVTLRRLADAGLRVVFHVHDEVIVEAGPEVSLKDVTDIMDAPIDWAPGLVLKAAGFECDYYQKD